MARRNLLPIYGQLKTDTSPLTALLTVGQADILLTLFRQVIVPEAVNAELLRAHAQLPPWLRVERVTNLGQVTKYLQTVDRGEAEAIELAKELHADLLLLDERKGRKLAAEEHVPVIGLLGVILLAKRQKPIPSARQLLNRLQIEAGIYLDAKLRDDALKTEGE